MENIQTETEELYEIKRDLLLRTIKLNGKKFIKEIQNLVFDGGGMIEFLF